MASTGISLDDCLRQQFGLEAFRPGQREVIETVLAGRDCLCVMPTGGGKSLCYQLPALVRPGLTLVVSPLIALMKDQVDALTARGIAAAFINSGLEPSEQRQRIAAMEYGSYALVYVAPERFRSARFTEALARVQLNLLAVDEAHCISEWGHDFRPDYAHLGQVRHRLGTPPTIALTATATDLVRRDICEQLDLRDPRLFVTGFDRPNLTYEVRTTQDGRSKQEALGEILRRTPGSGIVYAATRNRCEEVAQSIQEELGRSALIYHAGMPRDQRHQAQDRFMTGQVDVVVATNAFGMGVDKPDIRFVIHYNLPGTVEAYYQEAGRAGRDGQPSTCVLLYAPGDRYIQEFFIESEYPGPEVVGQVYEFLRGQPDEILERTQAEIKEILRLEISEFGVGTCLKLLEAAGVIERLRPRENLATVRITSEEDTLVGMLPAHAPVQRRVLEALETLVGRRRGDDCFFQPDAFAQGLGMDRGQLVHTIGLLRQRLPLDYIPPFRGHAIRILDRSTPAAKLDIDFAALAERKRIEYEKLEQIIRYARHPGCRRVAILRYFGDMTAKACGRCDNCRHEGMVPVDLPAAARTGERLCEAIVKALSGVARGKEQFGKGLIAQMLTGSNSEKVHRWGLNRLSTFGVLSELTQAEATGLIDSLIQAGCVEQVDVDKFRPVVRLTPLGAQVMRGDRPADLPLQLPESLVFKLCGRLAGRDDPIPAEPSEPSTAGAPPLDPVLLERLKALRDRWAAEARLPPHYILAAGVIEELARRRPRTPEALLTIKGIGPKKLELYGPALLEVLDDGQAEPPRSAPAAVERPPAAPAGPPPSHYWTWRLLDRGFTPDECAAIRGLELQTVFDHALRAAQDGQPVSPSAFLPPDRVAAIEAVIGDHPPERIRPLLARMPEGTRYEHVLLVLAARAANSRSRQP